MPDIKERPILFSAPMVKAILDGRKTMTRRVCKKQPEPHHWQAINGYKLHQKTYMCANGLHWRYQHTIGGAQEPPVWVTCPYGQVGDRLWVRESWRVLNTIDKYPPRDLHLGEPIQYEAGGTNLDGFEKLFDMGKLRRSIHMPRWASRILLEITGVRVERLRDISEEDAKAEGAEPSVYSWPEGTSAASAMDCNGLHRNGFRNLWESINGAGSWTANPYVWVIEFKRI